MYHVPFIEHKFGKTFYRSKGRKSARLPLVFLHGGPGGRSKPDSPLFELADERKVLLYDQIGGGKSTPIKKRQMTIATFVEELRILLDAWGLDECHLAGGSWGTTLALEYYLRHRGKGIRSLTFQSPMFSASDWEADAQRLIANMTPEDQKVIHYCHEIGATDAQVYKDASYRYYARHVNRNRKKLKEMMSNDGSNTHGGEVYRTMWGPTEFKPTGTLKSYDRTGDLHRIDVPVQFICGEHDEATPQTAQTYCDAIPQAKLSVIQGASHSISAEKPKPFIRTLRRFLREQD